jgi:hypothetical protein
MWVFISPISQAFSMMSWGQVPSLSYSHATRISFSEVVRARECPAAVAQRQVNHCVGSLEVEKPIDWVSQPKAHLVRAMANNTLAVRPAFRRPSGGPWGLGRGRTPQIGIDLAIEQEL